MDVSERMSTAMVMIITQSTDVFIVPMSAIAIGSSTVGETEDSTGQN